VCSIRFFVNMSVSLIVKNTFVYAVTCEQTNSADEGMRRSNSCPSLAVSRANTRDDVIREDSSPVSPVANLGTWADIVSDSEEEDHQSYLSSAVLRSFSFVGGILPTPKVSEKTTLESVLFEESDSDRTPLSSKASAFVPCSPLSSKASAFVPCSSQTVSIPKQEPEHLNDSVPDTLRQVSTQPQESTTVILRNLPCCFTRKSLVSTLNKAGFAGLYDFVYIPMDFQSRQCLGYGFVNLADGKSVQHFIEVFDGCSQWSRYASSKVCNASLSRTQGLAANIKRYRNSPVMGGEVPEDFKPALFVGGHQVPFPEPTRELPQIQQRIHRQ